MRRAVLAFYASRHNKSSFIVKDHSIPQAKKKKPELEILYQCKHCKTLYDGYAGNNDLRSVSSFELVHEDYTCPLCDAPKEDFVKIAKESLGLQTV